MLIKNRAPWEEKENAVTPESVYLNRRAFMSGAAGTLAGTVAAVSIGSAALSSAAIAATDRELKPLAGKPTGYQVDEPLTPFDAVTNYNNFYEFGTDKSDPAANAWRLQPKPWMVKVDGMVDRPGMYDLGDLVDMNALEQRIYRLRCVEAWSMVIPWIGIPLSSVLKKIQAQGSAKYVAFETLADKNQMNGIKGFFNVLDWPYREGLRMDEAMNDLAFLAVGLYDRELPNQNGAPLRLVVPWKYGFKSVKSIVRITLTDSEPKTSWNLSAPGEYGFYSNVNPNVDHPRWSQKQERRIGERGRRDTLMFNGYGDAVASLYQGMDLRKNF